MPWSKWGNLRKVIKLQEFMRIILDNIRRHLGSHWTRIGKHGGNLCRCTRNHTGHHRKNVQASIHNHKGKPWKASREKARKKQAEYRKTYRKEHMGTVSKHIHNCPQKKTCSFIRLGCVWKVWGRFGRHLGAMVVEVWEKCFPGCLGGFRDVKIQLLEVYQR